jgi:ACS family glucarate transporter-like MFS transporter
MLCLITVINYADRSTLAMAGPELTKQLGINNAQLGLAFSALGWSYVALQIPAGWLLDRFGSKRVGFFSIVFWSAATALQGTVGFLSAGIALLILFLLRLLVGLGEAPTFPANGRIVASWFPAKERGTASALFNASQYFATIIFAPFMGWVTSRFGWEWMFVVMGALGVVVAFLWIGVMYSPLRHPRLGAAELDYIREGGALVNIDAGIETTNRTEVSDANGNQGPRLVYLKQLMRSRMMLGIYLGQYCINTVTFFFVTWFPVYLVQARGLSILQAGFMASIPAICGFCGGVIGGTWSDFMLRRGLSLTLARKIPICLGLGLSMVMIASNYVDTPWVIIAIMSLAFFGKGIGALGWAVNSDAAPKEIAGLSGGLFNMLGNLSLITTPIIIGLLVQWTGSFNSALIFVGANGLVVVLSYVFLVGDIKRMVLVEPDQDRAAAAAPSYPERA